LRPVIADFGIGGLASEWAFSQEKDHRRAFGPLPTMLSGSHTAGYASPQQRGGCAPDPRDDVYALGVMWYQLAIGDMTSDVPMGSADGRGGKSRTQRGVNPSVGCVR
jgi:serine/threonine protein kinase